MTARKYLLIDLIYCKKKKALMDSIPLSELLNPLHQLNINFPLRHMTHYKAERDDEEK